MFPGRRVPVSKDGLMIGFGQPGDYGRHQRTLAQVHGCEDQLYWNVVAPDGSSCKLNPTVHRVIEHDDNSITVEPSIVTATWHGWLHRGLWSEA